MDDLEKMGKMRDLFREIADVLDEMLKLRDNTSEDEGVQEKAERLAGKYIIKLMELKSLNDN